MNLTNVDLHEIEVWILILQPYFNGMQRGQCLTSTGFLCMGLGFWDKNYPHLKPNHKNPAQVNQRPTTWSFYVSGQMYEAKSCFLHGT